MKKKNSVTLEEIEENRIHQDVESKNKKKVSFIKFLKQDVLPFTYICFVLCLLFTLAGAVSSVENIKSLECSEIFCGEETGIITTFINKIKMLGVTVMATLVPYFYLPFLGFLGYVYYEGIAFAHLIVAYGYAAGIIRYIIPFILNAVTISVVTSLSIYIEKIVTAKFVYNRKNAMNFTNFRLKVYEMTKKEDKYNELLKKSEKKTRKLEARVRPIEWKYVLIILGVSAALQFISVCIENLVI